ncbi:WD40-repeat-containing domain protein [Gongronella butleri]|nr:WD40-repeat-containing domain protein [Gongronella butleri]
MHDDEKAILPTDAAPAFCTYQYAWDTPPVLAASTDTQFNDSNARANNFFKVAKWSPDGACLLTNSEDRVVRVFEVPQHVFEDPDSSPASTTTLHASQCIDYAESVCDIAWYPGMTVQDTSTCCFLTSVRDHPVQLWDAMTGNLRASYGVIDHQERFIGPNVVTFNQDGSSIYCGYENMIEVFDLHASSSTASSKYPTTPNRKSRRGLKGLVSCIDFNPDKSGLYAAGSYSQAIGLFDERNHEMCAKYTIDKGSGVTQVAFSRDGTQLFCASRQANVIQCWDVRQSGNLLYELDRPGKTNQRLTFDLDPTGHLLITGDQIGQLRVYDLTTLEDQDTETKPRLVAAMPLHQDAISSAAFNPAFPSVVATSSGQRKFKDADAYDTDRDSDDELEKEQPPIDNSLRLWQVPGSYTWHTANITEAQDTPSMTSPSL